MTNVKALGPPEGSVATPSKAIEALFRYRRRFALVFGLGLLLTLLYVFVSPKKYESDMSLIVQNARKPEVLSAESTTGGAAMVTEVTEEELYSEVELLGSADVLDEVADPGWRNVPVTAHTREAQNLHESKVGKLRKHLVIAPVRKSHVIDVSYTASDPKVANETLNRLLAVYLGHKNSVSSPAGASTFFNDEAAKYQSQWKTAQQKLANFQQQHHLVTVADKETELQTAIAEALVLERAAQSEASEINHKIEIETRQLAATPKREKTMERVLPASGSIDQANTLLTQLELRRSELLTEYLPTDRLVQQLDSQIAAAKAQLAKSQTMNSVEVSSNINPNWQTQDQQIADDRAHFNAVSARAATIAGQIADLRNQLQQTERDTLEFATLQQDVTTLAANNQLYLQKHDAAQISEAMDAHGLINIGIAQSPTFSFNPVRPRPLIDTILGLVTSFLLACFAVYLAENSRRTISSPAELGGVTRHPVLATVLQHEFPVRSQGLSRT